MPSLQEIAVFKPLAYFAYFGYPLTAFEVWKWQFAGSSGQADLLDLGQVEEVLQESVWLRERVSTHHGMYAIGSPEDILRQVNDRHDRYVDAMEKERKLKRVLAFLRYVPGVQGVALCNSMPFHFTHKEGDIDLFVLTKPSSVWSARLLSVAPLIALRQRPGETDRHPIDASFFVSESAMDLSSLQQQDDPYFTFWIATLTPVLGAQSLWDRFFEANAWAFARLPNARPPQRAFRYRCRSARSWLPSLPESLARRVQEKRLPDDLKRVANDDSRVVITDTVLKFHRTDRREEIAKAFASKMRVCGE